MDEPWLRLEDVHLYRGGRHILRGVDAQVRGRAVGLVGANGAGKSTLIGAMLGVLRPSQGLVQVLDYRLPGQAMALRARAGVMAEQAGIFPGGSAVDAVAFAGALSGLSRREGLRMAHRALDALGVGEERYRDTSGYSTGMRQKCKLAMALVHEPDVLILDEPTVGLDPPTRAQLLALIRDLSESTRVLLSTHIMRDAEIVCDELIVIDSGATTYCGSTRDLMGERDDVLVARGDGLGPQLIAALEARGVRVLNADAGALTLPGDAESVAVFWQVAAESGAEVRHLGAELPTLEDAVVAAMEGHHVAP